MISRVVIVCSLLLSGVSNAVMADVYVGMGIGSASYNVDLTALGGGNFEDSSTGTKLYGGYSFNKFIAAEVAAYNFADASVGALETSPGSGTFVSAEAGMKGAGAYVVGIYPVTKKVKLMARLGMLNWNAELRFNNISGGNDGNDIAYAFAASYGLTKEFLVTAEWESFDSDNPALSMLSVGFMFIFK